MTIILVQAAVTSRRLEQFRGLTDEEEEKLQDDALEANVQLNRQFDISYDTSFIAIGQFLNQYSL